METKIFTEEVFCMLFTCAILSVLAWIAVRLMSKHGIRFEQPRKFPREEEKVTARLAYFSPKDGFWHVTFNLGFGTCYGIIANMNKGQGSEGVEIETTILSAPDHTCGFYRLFAIEA